jgi:MFS family permease
MSDPKTLPIIPSPGEAAIADPTLDLKGWRRTFASLHNQNYRYFFIGQSVSLIGSWTRSSALSWLAFAWTQSKLMTGMVSFANSVPMLLLSIYAGSLADRKSKITLFKITSWFALLSSALLAILVFAGFHSATLLLVFAALWGIAMAFEMPARQSLIVELVGPKILSNAIALNSAMVNSSRIIGPALGGLLLKYVGAAWCFILDSLSYLAVLVGLAKIRIAPNAASRPSPNVTWAHLMEGFTFVRRTPMVARTFGLMTSVSLFGWAYQSQMAPFVVTQLKQDAGGYGWLLAATGLGATVSAFLIAYHHERLKTQKPAYLGICLFSLSVLLLGFQKTFLPSACCLFCAGFGLVLSFATSNSFLQMHVPNHLRGRMMGLWALSFGGGMPLGSLWMGVLAEHVGSGPTLQIGGVLCLLSGSWVYFCWKKE